MLHDRTKFELYYPPYEAAIKAGAVAVMCAYNRAGGRHACDSSRLLVDDLRGELNFKGFVVSDWGATHDVQSVTRGLDVDMPGSGADDAEDGRSWFSPERLATVPASAVDAAVSRVLGAMDAVGLLDEKKSCEVGDSAPSDGGASMAIVVKETCGDRLRKDATSVEHRELARRLAVDATVMLKNDFGTLPLKPGARVAVVGGACDAPHNSTYLFERWDRGDYYVVGGSGRVVADGVVTVLDALQGRGFNITAVADDDLEAALAAAATADVGGPRGTQPSVNFRLFVESRRRRGQDVDRPRTGRGEAENARFAPRIRPRNIHAAPRPHTKRK